MVRLNSDIPVSHKWSYVLYAGTYKWACSNVIHSNYELNIKKSFNCFYSYAVRTNPADVARVESKTLICTENKYDTVPHQKEGVKCSVGQWADPIEMKEKLQGLFKGCMKGIFGVLIWILLLALEFYY